MGAAGKPILRGISHVQRLVFRVLSMIMWVAPIGAFGAIAAVVGETGLDALGLDKRGSDGLRLGPDGQPFIFRITFNTEAPETAPIAELLKEQIQKSGLHVELEVVDGTLWDQRRSANEIMALPKAWGSWPRVHRMFGFQVSTAPCDPRRPWPLPTPAVAHPRIVREVFGKHFVADLSRVKPGLSRAPCPQPCASASRAWRAAPAPPASHGTGPAARG